MTNFFTNSLKINCGLACLMRDSEGLLDKHDNIQINCGKLIVSQQINAKLNEKGAQINAGSMQVLDITGEVRELDANAVIGAGEDYQGAYLLATGDIIAKSGVGASLATAEGLAILGTLYYPDSETLSNANINGNTRAYPDGAYLLLGDFSLKNLLGTVPAAEKIVWVSGEISAYEEESLKAAAERGLAITCQKLLIYEGLNATYGARFNTKDREIVPDGYELVEEDVFFRDLLLNGPKLYIKGDLTIEESDGEFFGDFESIIVKGKVSLPVSLAREFRRIGKADSSFVYEGQLVTVNGFQMFTHAQLQAMAQAGVKQTIQSNGVMLFAEDVQYEDIDAIADLHYNGIVIASGAAKGAISAKVRTGNGIMGDPDTIQELTGMSMKELTDSLLGGGGSSSINMGVFVAK